MNFIGLDIGSTSSKTIVMNLDKEIVYHSVVPTGWSSAKTALEIKENLEKNEKINFARSKVVATGYGRVSVPYADKTLTEITCHGVGANFLCPEDCTVIDIGGQDTKIIRIENGFVCDFLMNDKCAAGTGRFLEVMANTLGVQLPEMFELAKKGSGVSISSMCAVFAESEVISLIGSGREKCDIAYGIVDSIINKVVAMSGKSVKAEKYFLTGGLCESSYILESLSKKLSEEVKSEPLARYAGAIGASIKAMGL